MKKTIINKKLYEGIILFMLLSGFISCNVVKKTETTVTKIDTSVTVPGSKDSFFMPLLARYDTLKDTCIIENFTTVYKTDRGAISAAVKNNVLLLEGKIDSLTVKVKANRISKVTQIEKQSKVTEAMKWGFFCLLAVLAIVIIQKFVS